MGHSSKILKCTQLIWTSPTSATFIKRAISVFPYSDKTKMHLFANVSNLLRHNVRQGPCICCIRFFQKMLIMTCFDWGNEFHQLLTTNTNIPAGWFSNQCSQQPENLSWTCWETILMTCQKLHNQQHTCNSTPRQIIWAGLWWINLHVPHCCSEYRLHAKWQPSCHCCPLCHYTWVMSFCGLQAQLVALIVKHRGKGNENICSFLYMSLYLQQLIGLPCICIEGRSIVSGRGSAVWDMFTPLKSFMEDIKTRGHKLIVQWLLQMLHHKGLLVALSGDDFWAARLRVRGREKDVGSTTFRRVMRIL